MFVIMTYDITVNSLITLYVQYIFILYMIIWNNTTVNILHICEKK